jgi:hypothetical protein
MAEMKFDVEFVDLDAIGVVTCGECNRITRHRMAGLKNGSILRCPCGEGTVELVGDIAQLQRTLDDLKKAFEDVGKSFRGR